MGSDHNALAIFDHVCFYSSNSLRYLAKQTGYEIESIDFYGLDIKDYFQSLDFKNKINLNKTLNKFANLTQSIIDNQKLSNSMRIIFQMKRLFQF